MIHHLLFSKFTELTSSSPPFSLPPSPFPSQAKWGSLPFPLPFGRTMSPEEDYIQRLDEKTGASLKLTILNPEGRIWNMVAGGGASVIFADTVCDVGYSHELANYGEYSGGPSEEETYLYAKTVISLATRYNWMWICI